jgi:hypothetical protein
MPVARYMVPGMRKKISYSCHVVKVGSTIWLSCMAEEKPILESWMG